MDALPPGTLWGSIDLRADSTQQAGRCLLFAAAPVTGPTLLSGNLDDALTAAQINALKTRFPSIDFSSVVTVRDAIKAVVLPRVWRDYQGRRQIWLANILVHEDVA